MTKTQDSAYKSNDVRMKSCTKTTKIWFIIRRTMHCLLFFNSFIYFWCKFMYVINQIIEFKSSQCPLNCTKLHITLFMFLHALVIQLSQFQKGKTEIFKNKCPRTSIMVYSWYNLREQYSDSKTVMIFFFIQKQRLLLKVSSLLMQACRL